MSTSPITFHECFGTVSKAQLAAYKRLNVSPMDHDLLVDQFGEDNHAEITAHVKANSESGMYREPISSGWGW